MANRDGCFGWIVLLTDVLAILSEHLVDLLSNFALRDLAIVLGIAVLGHEGQEAVVGDVQLYTLLLASLYPLLPVPHFLTSWYSRRETFGTSML